MNNCSGLRQALLALLQVNGVLLGCSYILVSLLLGAAEGRASSCIPLTETELAQQLSRYEAEQTVYNYHDSFYTVGACRFTAEVENRKGNVLTAHTYGALHRRCPQSVTGRPICSQSSSRTARDPDQYPPSLATVQCTCADCGQPNWGRCQGVPYYQRVLRKQRNDCDRNGKEVWRGSVAKVYLGCVCAQITTA